MRGGDHLPHGGSVGRPPTLGEGGGVRASSQSVGGTTRHNTRDSGRGGERLGCGGRKRARGRGRGDGGIKGGL